MNNLLSIIVPVYNAEHFLDICLSSLLDQTYKNLEIIIINDGSTDNSPNIINQFTAKDSRIISIHQNNQGVSAARNIGLKRATGHFVGFVDSDDELYPEMYETLLKNAVESNADISHCGFELVKQDKAIQFHGTGLFLVQDKYQGLEEILSGKRVEPSVCNKIYKRTLVENREFLNDIKFNEDLFFNVVAFSASKISVFHDKVLYKYLENGGSASRSNFTIKKAQDIYTVAKKIKDLVAVKELEFIVNRFYAAKLLTVLQDLKRNNLYSSSFAKELCSEVAQMNVKNMGKRIALTKILMVRFPGFYQISRVLYDFFFMKNQKWKK